MSKLSHLSRSLKRLGRRVRDSPELAIIMSDDSRVSLTLEIEEGLEEIRRQASRDRDRRRAIWKRDILEEVRRRFDRTRA